NISAEDWLAALPVLDAGMLAFAWKQLSYQCEAAMTLGPRRQPEATEEESDDEFDTIAPPQRDVQGGPPSNQQPDDPQGTHTLHLDGTTWRVRYLDESGSFMNREDSVFH